MDEYKVITIENLAEATAQEVYNHIVNHLIIQGMPSRASRAALDGKSILFNGPCLNRAVTLEGKILKCAGGCLITDKQYEKLDQKEGSWDAMVIENNITKNHQNLISDLQTTHDDHRAEKFEVSEFEEIADNYNLTPFPDTTK